MVFLGDKVLDTLKDLTKEMRISHDETEPKVGTQDIAFTSGQ